MESAKKHVWRWLSPLLPPVWRDLEFGTFRAGADVMVTDYSEDTHQKCEALVKQIQEMGRRSLSCVCDVRYPESVNRAVTKCKE